MLELSVFLGVTSSADRFVTRGESQYSAGKAAVTQILIYAQQELAFAQMKVVRFNPGAIATPMQDVVQSAGLAPAEEGPANFVESVAKRIVEVIANPTSIPDGVELRYK
jgi:NAD(P)-dependent dehydrogenase (short-subunit alcohol dehydrogenase family)